MENNDYPIYNFKIKEDGTDTGMVGISLVDEPAVESEFLTFKAENFVKETEFIILKDENDNYKQELLGAALRPDIPILRKDQNTGDYYYGVFTSDVIEQIRNKFHKQKNTSNVNLQHDEDLTIDAYLNESYIIQTQEQLDAVKAMGLENVELGAWIVRYKIESEELFNKIKNKEINVNGFSVEVFLNKELIEANKNNFNLNNKNNLIMSKFNKLVDRFKEVLAEFEEEDTSGEGNSDENKFETAKIAGDDGLEISWTEVEEPAYYVNDDGSLGDQLPDGTYDLEDGRQIIITNDVVSEVKEADGDGEDEEGDMKKEDENNTEANNTESNTESNNEELNKEEDKSNSEKQNMQDEGNSEGSDLDKTIRDMIPTDSDGTYQLEVFVSDGKISFGTLYSYTYKDLKFDKLVEEYEKLKKENVKLKKEPATPPVFSEFKSKSEKKNKKEFKNNLDYQLSRLNLE